MKDEFKIIDSVYNCENIGIQQLIDKLIEFRDNGATVVSIKRNVFDLLMGDYAIRAYRLKTKADKIKEKIKELEFEIKELERKL